MTDQLHRIAVSIEDGTKAAEEYAPARKVKVELTTDAYDAGQIASALDHLSNIANAKVAELLGRTAPAGKTAAPAAATADTAEPTKRTRRTKEQIAADEAAAAKAEAALSAAEPSADLGGFDEDETPAQDAKGNPVADPTALEDFPEDDFNAPIPPAEAVEEISNETLNAEVTKRNGELKNPTLIRTLIAEFNPDPTKVFQLAQIAQEQRADFLAKLKVLKAPA